MKSIKVCEYSRSRSFHDDLILQDQASGERSQDQWSSGFLKSDIIFCELLHYSNLNILSPLEITNGCILRVPPISIHFCVASCDVA